LLVVWLVISSEVPHRDAQKRLILLESLFSGWKVPNRCIVEEAVRGRAKWKRCHPALPPFLSIFGYSPTPPSGRALDEQADGAAVWRENMLR